MNQDPTLLSIFLPDLDQSIHESIACLGFAGDSRQLLVKEFIALCPVDAIVRDRQKKCQKILETGFQNFLPGCIEGVLVTFFAIVRHGRVVFLGNHIRKFFLVSLHWMAL
ncbi:MAG: hypothetical protein HQL76_07855 [Magnetococcales bacterium]|nr:hypothetical protein [Magnetococcales bacterium]